MQPLVAEVAPRHVDAERERQAGLEQPPLAEVDRLGEPLGPRTSAALVDEQPGVRAPGLHLVDDPVERHLAVREVAERHPQDEERRRHPSGTAISTSAARARVSGSGATTIGPYPEPMLAPCGSRT